MERDLIGKRALVTGGTAGLGEALVRELAARGAEVVFVARTKERVAALESELRREGRKVHGAAFDVFEKDAVHRVAVFALGVLGGLDLLVLNAATLGVPALTLLADTECESLTEALDANVLSPFRLAKATLGALLASARDGHRPAVLAISSDAARTPYPRWGAYGVSKAALEHLAAIWNEELRESGVAVMAIDPGDMDTAFHRQAVPDARAEELGTPRDAAHRILGALRERGRLVEVPSIVTALRA